MLDPLDPRFNKARQGSVGNQKTWAKGPTKSGASENFSTTLQNWWLGLPSYIPRTQVEPPKIIAVGGGKGGVGKSILSANLATKLAQAGYRVLLIDFDIGGANLHTHFGLSFPKPNLNDFLEGQMTDFAQLILPTQVPSLHLIAGGRDPLAPEALEVHGSAFDLVSPLQLFWSSILNASKNFGFHFVLFDLGAGTHQYSMDVFSAAHLGIVTVLPEPTSIENAYVFTKSALATILQHSLKQIVSDEEVGAEILTVLKANPTGMMPQQGYVERLKSLYQKFPHEIPQILAAIESRRMGIVVNQMRCMRDADVGNSMQIVCQRYFGFKSKFLGYLNYDETAWKSIQNRRLLVLDFPHAILSKRVRDVAVNVLQTFGLSVTP